MIKRLQNYDEDAIGTFITPPWLSFAHGLKYKRLAGQTQDRLDKMIREIQRYLKGKTNQSFLNYNEITRNLLSMDGLHYSFRVNKVLLTIYLNGLI